MDLEQLIVISKKTIDGPIFTINQIKEYYEKVNSKNNFLVKQIGISKLTEWKFDNLKNLSHKSGKFFKVVKVKNKNYESGILLQDEQGTLGVLTCIYKDILHFLVQFKKEPGNITSSQLSPTLQATLSNQNKVHGGNAPKYLEFFQNITKKNILFRASLPEQGNRYWKKYNDNVILKVDYFEESENYRWMTLGQIYEFSNIDNSINSCLRSVLSLLHKSEYKNIVNSEKIINIKNLTKSQKLNNSELKNSVIDFYSKQEDKLI
jgi:oxidase EvaA